MKVWHISDTHGHHHALREPDDVDLIIHSGDATNFRNSMKNLGEMQNFLKWFEGLNAKNKIFVAGNHDSSVEEGFYDKEDMAELGIIYLESESVTIDGFKIWGSPYCPRFGDWSFMNNDSELRAIWEEIPMDTDILITHTPPKGMLDLASSIYNIHGNQVRVMESVGCHHLLHRIFDIQPKLHCFGHIHGNNKSMRYNYGTRTAAHMDTIFSNASCCVDGVGNRMQNNGNVIQVF